MEENRDRSRLILLSQISVLSSSQRSGAVLERLENQSTTIVRLLSSKKGKHSLIQLLRWEDFLLWIYFEDLWWPFFLNNLIISDQIIHRMIGIWNDNEHLLGFIYFFVKQNPITIICLLFFQPTFVLGWLQTSVCSCLIRKEIWPCKIKTDRGRREVRGHPQRNREPEVTQADAQTKTPPDRGQVFDRRKNVGKEQSLRQKGRYTDRKRQAKCRRLK